MRRIALALAVVGALVLCAGPAQASHPRSYRGGPHRSYRYAPPRYYGPRPYRPPVVRAYPVYPWVVPAPVYPRPYYYPPASGFYYRGSGISIGIGF